MNSSQKEWVIKTGHARPTPSSRATLAASDFNRSDILNEKTSFNPFRSKGEESRNNFENLKEVFIYKDTPNLHT
jgi:hypothetical protein